MLLAPALIATMMSDITENLLSMGVALADKQFSHEEALWRSAVIAFDSEKPMAMALSTDHKGSVGIGAAMFACGEEDVDTSMADDALSELANVAAGQLNRTLTLDHAIGLPMIISQEASVPLKNDCWERVLLKVGQLFLVFSISTNPMMVKEYVR